MTHAKHSVDVKKKCREVLELTSGHCGQCSRLYRKAKEQIPHSVTHVHRDRRARKGDFRILRVRRINAVAYAEGMTYNRPINDLKNTGVQIDCKILADLAVTDVEASGTLVAVAHKNRTPAAV